MISFGPMRWPELFFFKPIAQRRNAKPITFRYSSENRSIGLNRVVSSSTSQYWIKVLNATEPSSHVLNGLLNRACWTAVFPRPGHYYVYIQIWFNQRPHPNNNRIIVPSVSSTLLMTGIHEHIRSAAQKNTASSRGVLHSNAGDWIFVKVID